MNWSDLRATLEGVDLAAITPLHDFVLVKQHPESSTIINPHVHMTQDYRWRSDRAKGLRTGTVVAVGRGDRLFPFVCADHPFSREQRSESAKSFRCRQCGKPMERDFTLRIEHCPMHVRPGDVVVYPQTPTSDVMIDGEMYSWLHEEQHIMAVLEADSISGEAGQQSNEMRHCASASATPEPNSAMLEAWNGGK